LSDGPRVAVAVPAYASDNLAEALDSLLSQTFERLVVVVVDERVEPMVEKIARKYVEAFPDRIAYSANSQRLGMVANWRRAFAAARDLAPTAPYFAWGSDHDVWQPRWAAALVEALDAHLDAVAAYPLGTRIDEERRVTEGRWHFSTVGERRPLRRLLAAQRGMSAGNMVYALFRAEAIERAGVFRPVLLPDRLLLLELALLGEFVQVEESLWHRRFSHTVTMARQRNALFADAPPWYTRLPWWIVHGAVLARVASPGVVVGSVSLAIWLQIRRRSRLLRRFAARRWHATRRLARTLTKSPPMRMVRRLALAVLRRAHTLQQVLLG
jgi:glycosyltransferase involved in cell wall biosynthesis